MPEQWLDYGEYAGGSGHTVVGTITALPQLWSPQLSTHRDLLVYLPPSYRRGRRRYPVLYMHDGQNLFDQATSYAGEWQVDETCEALSAEGIELIVVGVPNGGDRRMDEYAPFRNQRGEGGLGEAYVAFLVETVKPLIDRRFRTRPGREQTGIMGSSMGGLISLYAGFHRPDTFGVVGAMSPSLWFAGMAIFPLIRRARYTPARIYLDIGTREGGRSPVDRLLERGSARRYAGNTFRMAELLVAKGYRPGRELWYIEEPLAIHHESAWARRLPHALRLLFGRGRRLDGGRWTIDDRP